MLGQAVHEVLEALSLLAADRRFSQPLSGRLEKIWQSWFDRETELKLKERAREMLRRVETHPGPLTHLAVKIKMELPYYWLSEADEIILCGRIDWLEYLPASPSQGGPESDSVHIIDFKTGRSQETNGSLQLPIYYLLTNHAQERPVKKMSYWYLDRDNAPKEQPLPDAPKAEAQILKIAKEIKLAKKLNRFKCPHGGCRFCRPYEDILAGNSKKVGVDKKGYDLYVKKTEENKPSEIL